MLARIFVAIIVLVFIIGMFDCPFWPKTKWGFIDKNGNMVIPANFDRVQGVGKGNLCYTAKPQKSFCEGMAAVAIGDLWGFIDKKGNTVIKPQYKAVGDFSEGLACIESNEKCGFIDQTGKLVIPLKFTTLPLARNYAVFHDGLCPAELETNQNGYIDNSGNFVIEPKYSCVWPFSEGRGIVIMSRPEGEIVDTEGKIVSLPANCELNLGIATGFSDGLARVRKVPDEKSQSDYTGHYWFVDRNGKQVTKELFGLVKNFSEGLAAVDLGVGKYGYINHNSEMVIQPAFDEANEFHEGLAAVGIHNPKDENKHHCKWGYIDKTGSWIVKPKYDDADVFSEGRASVRIDGSSGSRHGFIDKTGNLVVPIKYAQAFPFSEGLAAVKL